MEAAYAADEAGATAAPAAHRPVENAPTRAFLAGQRGAGRAVDTGGPGFRRFGSWFPRPLLTRPGILDASEVRQLDHDLPVLLRTLQSLPERLFGGDTQALAHALGWTQPGVETILRRLSGPAVPLGRADLVRTPSGFQVVEFNTSSSLGSLEFGELCRAMLSDPAFRDFAAREGLGYADPLSLMAETLLAATGMAPGTRPVLALVKWVRSPVNVDASLFTELMTEAGFTLVPCTVDQLVHRDGALYADGTRVDAVYRTFLLKTAAEDPDAPRLLAPLADAVEDGAARLFSPLNADLAGTKSCMAMLSDERNRWAFTPGERDVIDRVLPWTRSLRGAGGAAGSAAETEADGARVPLVPYVREHREELVLKPSVGHAGRGVVAGWMVSQEEWESQLDAALSGNYIVQRRATSVAERFYGTAGQEEPSLCFLHWGLFVTGAGFGGGFIKGLLNKEQDMRYLGDGSHVGCVFHARSTSA